MVKISKKQIVSRLGLFAGAALAGVILTGCAEEVNQWWGGGQPKVEVTASVQTADPQAVTRAADGLNVASTGFSDNTKSVYIGVNKGTAGADTWTPYEFGISGTGNLQTLTPPASGPAFPSGVNSVQVYGWYPYNSGNKTFTVSAAQNTNANYNASDLMLANSAACTHNGTTVTPASLTFRHALTKMKVTVTPLSGVTINSITLKSMKKTVTINDDNKAALTVGEASSEGDITLYSGTSTAAVTQCAVFPAQSKSDALLVVNATTAGGGTAHDVTYSLSASKTFTADKEYQMNISLGPTDVQTQTITLEDWQLAEGTFNKGGGSLAFDKSTLAMAYGTTETLQITGSVTIGSNSPPFTVTSSNTSVATVSTTGTTVTVTPAGIGTATITVTDANKPGNTASCNVTVAKGTPSMTLSTTELSVSVSSSNTFTVTTASDGVISASSSDNTKATVSVEGKTVTVNGVAEGSATITVTMAAGTNYEAYTALDKTVSVTVNSGSGPTPAASQANNPLYYMAETNYNGSGFYGDNDAKETYWMCTWVWANNNKSATLDGASGWHIPSNEEFNGILPPHTITNLFGTVNTATSYTEEAGLIKRGSKSLPAAKSVYYGTGSSSTQRVVYAVRYINTDYCSVWKYTREATNTTTIASGGKLTIESFVLATKITSESDATTLVQELSNGTQAWPASGTVKRVLPACGYKSDLGGSSNPGTATAGNQSSLSGSGENCRYWSSTESGSSNGWFLNCNGSTLYVIGNRKKHGHPLRLFRD